MNVLSLPKSRVTRGRVGVTAFVCGLLLAGAMEPAHALSPDESIEMWVGKAHQLYLIGDVTSAQAVLDRAITMNPQHSSVAFEQALLRDAEGQHAQARALYEALNGTERQQVAAIPSAVNLVALGRTDEARRLFETIAAYSQQRAERDYAQLWELLLTAQDRDDDAVSRTAVRMTIPVAPYQRALMALYAGEGTVAAVLDAADRVTSSDSERRNARAEAAFFAAGWLRHVRHDPSAALDLYKRGSAIAQGAIERPLFQQAIASLKTARR